MTFTIKTTLNASCQHVYNAWLNSQHHSEMTGGEAFITDQINDSFTAWNEYISGKNLELIANEKIVQEWRTTEFSDDEENSIITIELKDNNGKTELTLTHSHLPEHGEQYKKGWEDHYFNPMKTYFENHG